MKKQQRAYLLTERESAENSTMDLIEVCDYKE